VTQSNRFDGSSNLRRQGCRFNEWVEQRHVGRHAEDGVPDASPPQSIKRIGQRDPHDYRRFHPAPVARVRVA
jgi:hypothetical protein